MSRAIAFDVLREVTGDGAYANLALAHRLDRAQLSPRDAAFVTELVSGTCRLLGTYDRVIELAGGRRLSSLQPAVVDVLRLGAHQLLSMRIPTHAAVSTTVELAKRRIGRRVTGLVNAILRRVAAQPLDAWLDRAAEGADPVEALAIRGHHPTWIAEAYAQVLPGEELEAALAANNVAPVPTLVVRPGLATVQELGGTPCRYSPFGAVRDGDPADVPAVHEGRAGVQDEGSQLVALALSRVQAPEGPWLDLCAGPGGKAALLHGLARDAGQWLLASEARPHRAHLVRLALRGYASVRVVVADGTRPAWRPGSFARVMADVPCSGLGALRRRPEARWRRGLDSVEELAGLQRELLGRALDALRPGGVAAYVTCSPHPRETSDCVEEVLAGRDDVELLDAGRVLPEVPDAARGPYVQLWPHRHGTDAMFLALLRRR
ncbi:RsmB/NOP family class I SAM-dependent RNA methyltransferase [uncultured Tessaracoccus sp.]|uniref:RsmB/NOP family class I SAM-dependent RNA methyltransferase n=1 Tax=uncultured Tessaracoccus sp. TaxID=905023 RepID=UPI0026011D50|nr:transcription antitermination factor NusB [uncultured Tessaracoccus sp.]